MSAFREKLRMGNRTFSRREMLRSGLQLLVVGSVLGGCSEAPIDCTDTSALGTADRQLRVSLGYQDQSPFGKDKSCLNCDFFESAGRNQCGTCTLIQGPINPGGYCKSWAAKQV